MHPLHDHPRNFRFKKNISNTTCFFPFLMTLLKESFYNIHCFLDELYHSMSSIIKVTKQHQEAATAKLFHRRHGWPKALLVCMNWLTRPSMLLLQRYFMHDAFHIKKIQLIIWQFGSRVAFWFYFLMGVTESLVS